VLLVARRNFQFTDYLATSLIWNTETHNGNSVGKSTMGNRFKATLTGFLWVLIYLSLGLLNLVVVEKAFSIFVDYGYFYEFYTAKQVSDLPPHPSSVYIRKDNGESEIQVYNLSTIVFSVYLDENQNIISTRAAYPIPDIGGYGILSAIVLISLCTLLAPNIDFAERYRTAILCALANYTGVTIFFFMLAAVNVSPFLAIGLWFLTVICIVSYCYPILSSICFNQANQRVQGRASGSDKS